MAPPLRKITQVMHQIWSGVEEPLPKHFKNFGKTWQYDYPD